jgi:outer membrane protein TolC
VLVALVAGVSARAEGAGALDFDACVQLALEQSPLLSDSLLEMELRRLGESDSRSDYVPSVSLRTRYFVTRPDDSNRRYSLMFVSDAYNPLEAHITLKARKLITQIAVLAHKQAISDCLYRLGQGLLEIHALDQKATLGDENLGVAGQQVAYTTNLVHMGSATALETQIALQEVEMARLERERVDVSRTTVLEGLKSLLGLPGEQALDLDLDDVTGQVLGDFKITADLEMQATTNDLGPMIESLEREVQEIRVVAARAEYVPDLRFVARTEDPLSADADGDLFFAVGVDLPLWDGLTRARNVKRQKMILQQHDARIGMKDIDRKTLWRDAEDAFRAAEIELRLARAEEELSALKAQQEEIRYESGGQPMSLVLSQRRSHLEAREKTAMKTLQWAKAALYLRYLSGHLYDSYIAEESF